MKWQKPNKEEEYEHLNIQNVRSGLIMFHNDYDVLTAYEAMDYLGVGENTIYKLLNSGELCAFRIGKTWKIPRKEIDKYIDKSVKKNTAANTKK